MLDENINLDFLPASIDGIVYCPGAISLRPFNRIPADDFIKDYNLQVVGAVKIIQAALLKLKESKKNRCRKKVEKVRSLYLFTDIITTI